MTAQVYPMRRGPVHMADALTLSLLTLYVAVKDIMVPLVRRHRPSKVALPEKRLVALEVDLGRADTRIIDLDKALMGIKADMGEMAAEITETSTSINNKLDLMLDESRETRQELGERLGEVRQELGERLAKVETHVEHLLAHAKPAWKRP